MAIRAKHIRKLAENLLMEHGVHSAPVPVEAIARAMLIDIKKSPVDDSLSGFLLRHGKRKAIIGVNSNHHCNRQRFTIAHELGHFLLHLRAVHVDRNRKDIQVKLRSEASGAKSGAEEIEANLFAAELLMPAEHLKSDIAKYHLLDILDENALEKVLAPLASKYEVSTQALMYRLVNLGCVRLDLVV